MTSCNKLWSGQITAHGCSCSSTAGSRFLENIVLAFPYPLEIEEVIPRPLSHFTCSQPILQNIRPISVSLMPRSTEQYFGILGFHRPTAAPPPSTKPLLHHITGKPKQWRLWERLTLPNPPSFCFLEDQQRLSRRSRHPCLIAQPGLETSVTCCIAGEHMAIHSEGWLNAVNLTLLHTGARPFFLPVSSVRHPISLYAWWEACFLLPKCACVSCSW